MSGMQGFGVDAPGNGEAVSVRAVQPPTHWLVASGLFVVLGIAAFPFDGVAAHAAGYLLAGIVALTGVTIFSRLNNKRRQSPYYSPRGSLDLAVRVLPVAGVVVAAGHACFLALELAAR